ncbi:MAG: PEP-CTERM sorting domain-containing protein [Rhodospirillaceae bacterium]
MKKMAAVIGMGAGVALLAGAGTASAQTVRSAAGTVATLQSSVDAFRADLGALNPNVIGSLGSGRREINWDGVPDALAAPNNLPANFFNVNSPRGVVFNTPGTGFQVSANAASGTPVEFGNINATYPTLFTTFSPQRLFTALGSAITDVLFFLPGSTTAALTRGFGSVFTDVDLANVTSLQFFGADGSSLGTFFVPAVQGNETLSFVGVTFAAPIVSRVRITSGSSALGPIEAGQIDLVVMDDFIYGEPIAAAIPEPGTIALLGTGILALATRRRMKT